MPVTYGSDYGTPSLDLNFARNKSLIDTTTGRNLITFTRSSTGTYVGADGLIKTAKVDEPRFDHNPITGVCNGLLIEESRTNEITDSMPTTSGGTGITNTLVNDLPGSFSTGRRLTSSGGNDIRIILGINTLNVVFTYSFFARAGTQGNYVFLRNGTSSFASWNLNTNTVTRDDFGTAKIENYGNGWWRCYVTITGSGGSGFLLGVGDSGLNSVNGDNIIIAGVQLERGSFPTSYIPTSGSTVTRSADVASITGTNYTSFTNLSEGTWFSQVNSIAPSSGGRIFDSRLNSSSTSILYVSANSSGYSYSSGSSIQINATYPLKGAVSYNTSQVIGAANGLLSTSNTGGRTADHNNIDIGSANSAASGVGFINAPIARLTYYPKRLPNYQLQALTR